MRRREAVRPCPGIGEAVRGIAGWRAGTGEQGGTGSIPYNTHAYKFFKTVDCLKANTPHGCWVVVGAGRGRKRGRRANEGTRRSTAPRDDGAHGRLTARSDRAGGKTDGAPRNEEGRGVRLSAVGC